MRRLELERKLTCRDWIAAGGAILLVLGLLGCDRSPKPPTAAPGGPGASTNESASAEQVRPTTQELENGPYKPITLPGTPLIVQVPQSWKVEMGKETPITFLAGPTPSSELSMIQFAQHDTVKPEQIQIIANHARQPQQDKIERVKLHDVGKMKVLERLALGNPESNPKVDNKGDPILDSKGQIETETITPVRWTVTAFVPYQGAFSRYDLNIIDLTAEQYRKDKPVLEKIINSLEYEGEGAGASTAPATSVSE